MAKRRNEMPPTRVRYMHYPKPTGPKGETESFRLEMFDPEDGWCLDTEYFFSKSVLWPEADYVSIDIVTRMFQLMHLGSHLSLCKAGEE